MNDNYIWNRTWKIIGRFHGDWLRDGTGKLVARHDKSDDFTRDRASALVRSKASANRVQTRARGIVQRCTHSETWPEAFWQAELRRKRPSARQMMNARPQNPPEPSPPKGDDTGCIHADSKPVRRPFGHPGVSVFTLIIEVALLLGFHNEAFGYLPNYGPFRAGQKPVSPPLFECKLVAERTPTGDDIEGALRRYRPAGPGKPQTQTTLVLRGTSNGWVISLVDTQGRNLLPTAVTNSMTRCEMEVFSCDLNKDGLPDFIVNVWSGGTGLAMSGSEVTFLLSNKEGYRAASFYLFDFGKEDLVQFKVGGPVYFILNNLMRSDGEKTLDGRDHNFWVYELYRIDRASFVPANADRPGFPKWVWYSNRDNHEETTQLTSEQKAKLMKKHRAEFP